VCIVGLTTSSCTLAELNRLNGNGYALDTVDREPAPHSGPRCHPESLIRYRGTWLKLEPASQVAPPFAARLEQFEELLTQVGQKVYGRAPTRIAHVGTYACREVVDRTARLSEHALGNAIDVTGFYFPALPFASNSRIELPARLKSSFTVTVVRDYVARGAPTPISELHQRFFDQLIQALEEREIFRGMIGPPDPAHRTHLHLDMAPWSYRRLERPPYPLRPNCRANECMN
jgi:extensin-like protein